MDTDLSLENTVDEVLKNLEEPLVQTQVLLTELGADFTYDGLVVPLYTDSFNKVIENISNSSDEFRNQLRDQNKRSSEDILDGKPEVSSHRSFRFGSITFKEIHRADED